MDKIRVLVVDDVEQAALMLSDLLEQEGFNTRTATNGADALAFVSGFDPHVVLLDLGMPGMDGFELIKHLRAQHGKHIVLIAVTGADPLDKRVAMALKACDAYAAKPVDLSSLIGLLASTPPPHDTARRLAGA